MPVSSPRKFERAKTGFSLQGLALVELHLLLIVLLGGSLFKPLSAGERSGWGIDAWLSSNTNAPDRSSYLDLLGSSTIRWLRERNPNIWMAEQQNKGFKVVSFIELEDSRPQQRGNHLREDLLSVFASAQSMQKKYGLHVDAWEMVGEPDLGYCTDLPDRLAAFQKAVYLGIKRGALAYGDEKSTIGEREQEHGRRPEPFVLMGALGNAPGPWLERAARNRLLEYSDAYNFHFYGHAEDFTSVINVHAAFVKRWDSVDRGRSTLVGGWEGAGQERLTVDRSNSLPFWVTESGMNAVDPDDFLNPVRRQLQAEFTVSTAKQALAHSRVSIFMPFILVHKGDPYAMTLSATKPLPAWNAYAKFTRENAWPQRPLARIPANPNPLVVQWLPDNETTVTHKVSGTYRFKGDQPIVGAFKLYNFSEQAIHGQLNGGQLKFATIELQRANPHEQSAVCSHLSASKVEEIIVPSMGVVSVPVIITARQSGYFSEFYTAEFVSDDGRRSPVHFGIERAPIKEDFVSVPLRLAALKKRETKHPIFPGQTKASESGVWTGFNGLKLQAEAVPVKPFQVAELPAINSQLQALSPKPSSLTVWAESIPNDPLAPPIAIARVKKLPKKGFIYLKTNRPMTAAARVRVDLVDRVGRRFAIWENVGMRYSGPNDEAWLNLADFNSYAWGRITDDPRLHPEQVEEIQLRFFIRKANDPFSVSMEFRHAKNTLQDELQVAYARQKGWGGMGK
ncbi:hypothetical protein [Oleiharenicola lentus]|uniref:hypothetical protein n=1 Tax=Oleiharenicola lentus TaxID=2508720 RepID=UPI003F6654DC